MKLIQLRKQKELTQFDLAEKLNCHQTTISKLEHQKSRPSFEMIQKLAEVLDVDLQTISDCFVEEKQKEE